MAFDIGTPQVVLSSTSGAPYNSTAPLPVTFSGSGGSTTGIVFYGSTVATLTNVPTATTSAAFLAANSSRKGVFTYNNCTANLYLKYGTAASTLSFNVKIAGSELWEMPLPTYTGVMEGVWESTGSTRGAQVTEQS